MKNRKQQVAGSKQEKAMLLQTVQAGVLFHKVQWKVEIYMSSKSFNNGRKNLSNIVQEGDITSDSKAHDLETTGAQSISRIYMPS